MPRTIVIGDVHGCLAELDELIGKLDPRASDRLFFLGDLVDRGPDSVGVVRRVRALLAAFPGSLAVCGNHEENALRNRHREGKAHVWSSEATEADWEFLDALPLWHADADVPMVLVHGGFYPRFFEHYETLGEPPSRWKKGGGRRTDRMRRFLRVRNVNAKGEMVALGEEGVDAVHWTERYDGRAGFCFFGHDPQLHPPFPLRARHATGLDTGCCFGGRLTAAVLAEGTRPEEAEFVSVAARARYAEPRFDC